MKPNGQTLGWYNLTNNINISYQANVVMVGRGNLFTFYLINQ